MNKPTAVVIGVGSERGVGGAVCRRFAREGYHVLIAGRTATKIDAVANALIANGGRAEAVVTDVTQEAQVIALFDRAMNPGTGRAPADVVVWLIAPRSEPSRAPRLEVKISRLRRVAGSSRSVPVLRYSCRLRRFSGLAQRFSVA